MAVSHVFTTPAADGTNTTIVRPSDWNSAHNQFATLTGNTVGVSTLSGTNFIFSGAPNVTLSGVQGADVATIAFSGGAGAAGNTGYISGGTTNVSLGTVSFADSNGVSFGVNGQTLTATVKTDYQSSNPNYLTSQSNQNVTAGNGGFAFQTLSFSNANNFSFGTSAGSAITGSYTVPTVTNSSWTVSDSATSGSVARLAFTNLNGVTLSLSTGAGGSHTIVASHNALTSQSNQALSGSNGSFTFQTATFGSSNGMHFYSTNGSLVGSYTVPTVPAQFSGGNTALGNTLGDSGVVTGQLVLAGGNNITLSGSTNAGSMTITISGPTAGGAQTGISGIGASDTTYTSGTVIWSNQANITVGTSVNGASQYVRLSVAAQSNQQLTLYATGNTTQSSTGTSNASSVIFRGDGIVSVGITGGSILISGAQTSPVVSNAIQSVGSATGSGTNTSRFAADDHVHAGVFSMGVSTVGNTSGDTRVDVGRFVLQGGNNITLSQVTAANALNTIIFSGPTAGGAQTGISGIAASNTTYTSGSVTFRDLNGISWQSTTGQQIQITHDLQYTSNTSNITSAALHTSAALRAIYDGANSISTGTIRFTNANGVSFSINGQTISGSVVAQTNQTLGFYGSSQTTGSASSGTLDARSVSIIGAGIVSVGMHSTSAGGTTTGLVISATQSNQAFSAGAASSTFQTLSFQDSNGLSFSNNAGAIRVSYTRNVASNAIQPVSSATGSGTNTSRFAADDHVHEGVYHVGLSTAGNTAGNTFLRPGRIAFQGANAITLSGETAANSLQTIHIQGPVSATTISAVTSANVIGTRGSRFALEDHQHAGVYSMGVSTAGNTIGDTKVGVGRFILQGGNNITLSQITAANELNTVVISAGAGGAAGTQSVGMSTQTAGGATAGTTGYATGTAIQYLLVPGSNITMSQSVNGASGTMSIYAPAPGAAAENNWMNALGANTSGNTTASGSTIGLSGINLTISGTNNSVFNLSVPATSSLVGTSGMTISTGGSTISVQPVPVSGWVNGNIITAAGSNMAQSSMSILPFSLAWPLAASQLEFAASLSRATTTNTSSAGFAVGISAVLYSMNGASLTSFASGSMSTTTFHQSNSTSSIGNVRKFTISLNAGQTLTPGQYWLGVHASTTTSGAISLGLGLSMGIVPTWATAFGAANYLGSNTTNTRGILPGMAIHSTGATRASIAFSDITGHSGNSASLANLWFGLRNQTVW